MQVRRDQCSGHAVIDFFFCGRCKRMVLDAVVHDGGYDTHKFCKRCFCKPCMDEIKRVESKPLVGPMKRLVIDCRFCPKPLESYFLRQLGPVELLLYNKINITCAGCNVSFGPFAYAGHLAKCPGKFVNQLNVINCEGPLLDRPYSEVDLLYAKNCLVAEVVKPSCTGRGEMLFKFNLFISVNLN